MKKILILSLSLFIASSIFADSKLDRIAFVNIQQIIEVVFSDKSSLIQGIKDEKNKMQENLNKLKEAWTKLEQDKISEKDDARKIAYDKKIEELKKQYADYYRATNFQIEQKIKTVQEPFFKEIYNVVKKISETQGYSVVFDVKTDGVFYYAQDNDITQKVIEHFKGETK